MASQIKAFQSTDLTKLKCTTIDKQIDTLKRANESFNIHHTTVFEYVEGGLSKEQYNLELTQLVDELRESLENLQDCQVATAVLDRLDVSLGAC